MARNKIILIAIAAVLVLAAGLLYWRHMRVEARKRAAVKIRIAHPTVKKKPTLPAIAKSFSSPKVVIVMDDFGYSMKNIEGFLSINRSITLSILPGLAHSREISSIARAKGYEVILHLPLEPKRTDVRQEVDTINSRMTENEVIARLDKDLKSIGGAVGISNHMGSKSTEEKSLMTIILKRLKAHGLYFFDSLTSQKSVCREVAKETGVKYARRDVFLDMGRTDSADYIKKQILETRRIAFRKGRAIAVCHDREITVKVLREMMPELANDGIVFVYLSEFVN